MSVVRHRGVVPTSPIKKKGEETPSKRGLLNIRQWLPLLLLIVRSKDPTNLFLHLTSSEDAVDLRGLGDDKVTHRPRRSPTIPVDQQFASTLLTRITL